jgi:hypothetical protein
MVQCCSFHAVSRSSPLAKKLSHLQFRPEDLVHEGIESARYVRCLAAGEPLPCSGQGKAVGASAPHMVC